MTHRSAAGMKPAASGALGMVLSGEPAVSVHAYSPPLAAMLRYNLTPAGLVPAATQSTEQA